MRHCALLALVLALSGFGSAAAQAPVAISPDRVTNPAAPITFELDVPDDPDRPVLQVHWGPTWIGRWSGVSMRQATWWPPACIRDSSRFDRIWVRVERRCRWQNQCESFVSWARSFVRLPGCITESEDGDDWPEDDESDDTASCMMPGRALPANYPERESACIDGIIHYRHVGTTAWWYDPPGEPCSC